MIFIEQNSLLYNFIEGSERHDRCEFSQHLHHGPAEQGYLREDKHFWILPQIG
uniref:Uncharacterized protein n=1 Tax=Tetranychus urticae TaxID=32264 RepID=T1KU01_TETUR